MRQGYNGTKQGTIKLFVEYFFPRHRQDKRRTWIPADSNFGSVFKRGRILVVLFWLTLAKFDAPGWQNCESVLMKQQASYLQPLRILGASRLYYLWDENRDLLYLRIFSFQDIFFLVEL